MRPARCTRRGRRSRSATSLETATRSRPAGAAWGRSGSRAAAPPMRARAGAFCRLWPRCSASRSTANGFPVRHTRPRRCAVPTRSRRRCSASVSHDLRTPLMAISTSAGALASPELAIDEADRDELLATILSASDRLDHLVGNLLDLSRLQAGAAEPQQALVELDEIVVGRARRARGGGRADRRVASGRSARGLGRRPPDPARAREPDRERAEVLTRRRARPHPGCRDRIGGARSA